MCSELQVPKCASTLARHCRHRLCTFTRCSEIEIAFINAFSVTSARSWGLISVPSPIWRAEPSAARLILRRRMIIPSAVSSFKASHSRIADLKAQFSLPIAYSPAPQASRTRCSPSLQTSTAVKSTSPDDPGTRRIQRHLITVGSKSHAQARMQATSDPQRGVCLLALEQARVRCQIGALRWTFHPLPKDAAAGGANAWSRIVIDDAHGLAFVPTGSASPDYFGGLRIDQDG